MERKKLKNSRKAFIAVAGIVLYWVCIAVWVWWGWNWGGWFIAVWNASMGLIWFLLGWNLYDVWAIRRSLRDMRSICNHL